LDVNHKVKRELSCDFHIIVTSAPCQSACPRHYTTPFFVLGNNELVNT